MSPERALEPTKARFWYFGVNVGVVIWYMARAPQCGQLHI
jgi:hypothetical protein